MFTHIEGAKIIKLSKKKHYCTVTMKDSKRCETPICYWAICKYNGDSKYYLFSCDENMNVHDTDICDNLDDAVNEANIYADDNEEIEWSIDHTE